MRAIVAAAMLMALACARDTRGPADTAAVLAVRDSSASAGVQTSRPGGGCLLAELWSPCLLKKALENAGLAPQEVDSVHHSFFGVAGRRWRLGRAELQTFIYPTIAALSADLARFDTARAQPRGSVGHIDWTGRPETITSRNLLAFLIGGNDRQRERIRDAMEAGVLGVRPR
jgi:hypothetical protein